MKYVEGVEVGDDGERSRIVANSTSALYVGSPAVSDGYVVGGGFFRRDTRSLAACLTKSSNVVAGNGIECGQNFTVSTTRSALVRGK